MHNCIQGDRYNPTQYVEEKKMLTTKDNKAYTLIAGTETKCIQNVSTDLDIDKEIDKDIKPKKNSHFVPPTLAEVQAHCTERHNQIDPEAFISFYESNGWMVGKNKMKSWKAAIVTWEKREPKKSNKTNQFNQHDQRQRTPAQSSEIERKLLNRGL